MLKAFYEYAIYLHCHPLYIIVLLKESECDKKGGSGLSANVHTILASFFQLFSMSQFNKRQIMHFWRDVDKTDIVLSLGQDFFPCIHKSEIKLLFFGLFIKYVREVNITSPGPSS